MFGENLMSRNGNNKMLYGKNMKTWKHQKSTESFFSQKAPCVSHLLLIGKR